MITNPRVCIRWATEKGEIEQVLKLKKVLEKRLN